MRAAWKIPSRWSALALPDRTALYPALHLLWGGEEVVIGREVPAGRWAGADLRVMVTDGPLAEDERDLMAVSAARGRTLVIAPQAPLPEADRALAAELGFPIVGWIDPGPLSSPLPRRPGQLILEATGCAARLAEDRILMRLLDRQTPERAARRPGGLVAAVQDAAALEEIRPALERRLVRSRAPLAIACQDPDEHARIQALGLGETIDPAAPELLELMGQAEIVLCVFPAATPEDPRPGQWARTALFAGAPVIAASHPSLDGLAHLCVLDDWERGLQLYARFPGMRLRATAAAAAELAERLEPARIAAEWTTLAERAARPPARLRAVETKTPVLLVLIDIHQDLDVLLPVMLALKARGEVRQRVVATDWVLAESPRVRGQLEAHGFEVESWPREAVREGKAPQIAGAAGVLCGAETNTRAHKAGHTLVGRAKAQGLPTFTLQHGFENIGLTYKDHLHGEDIRFAAGTIFTWAGVDSLAAWAAPETRAAVVPAGSPKSVPAPARALRLNQGHWRRTVGVFENLHWHRFSELYLEQALGDLQRAAREFEDVLFLVKPHHAGRWLIRHPERLAARPNLVVVDPTDSAWEPHTAPALIAGVDLVLTTPSTVALDAVRGGRPTAVLGYDLELPLYEPLPIIRRPGDLDRFLEAPIEDGLRRNEAFLRRAQLPGRADHRIAAAIAAALREGRAAKPKAAVRS